MPETWRDQMRRYKDRWLIGLSIVVSVLFHILLIGIFWFGKLGAAFPENPDKNIDIDLSQIDTEALQKMAPEDRPDRLYFQKFQGNQQSPQKADAYGFQDHAADRTTHRGDRPIEEVQRNQGPHGPGQGAGSPGSAQRSAKTPKMPKVGEGVGEPSPDGASGAQQTDKKARSVDQMIAKAGMPAAAGGGGNDGVNPYNPNVGAPGEILSISTREYKYMGYFAHMKEKIEMAWVYPQASQQNGQQGITTLRFVVLRSGQVDSVDILKTSGYQLLDRYAVKAVREANFNPMPDQWPDKQLTVVANFIYQLIGVRSVQ